MNKVFLWIAAAAAALVVVYLTMPWLVKQAAALLIGLVGVMTGLLFRKKRGA